MKSITKRVTGRVCYHGLRTKKVRTSKIKYRSLSDEESQHPFRDYVLTVNNVVCSKNKYIQMMSSVFYKKKYIHENVTA